jgi:hypothetical protein
VTDAAAQALTCAWFSSTDSCFYAPVTAALRDCTMPDAQGTASPDGTRCTFESGAVVTFPTAYSFAEDASFPGFTLSLDGGAPCLATTLSGADLWLTTGAGTTSFTFDAAALTVTLTCPDGGALTGSALELNDCSKQGLGLNLAGGFSPGDAAGNTLQVQLQVPGTDGTMAGSAVAVFTCSYP